MPISWPGMPEDGSGRPGLSDRTGRKLRAVPIVAIERQCPLSPVGEVADQRLFPRTRAIQHHNGVNAIASHLIEVTMQVIRALRT